MQKSSELMTRGGYAQASDRSASRISQTQPPRSYLRSACSDGYRRPRAYINGGYFTPWGYQPYSMTITPTFGGAIYQGNGGMMGFGTYSPYVFGGFLPSYGWGGAF